MVSSVSALEFAEDPGDSAPVMTRDGHRTVVWLTGSYDMVTVSGLADTLAAAVTRDSVDVIVDLSGMTFVDAVTLEVITRCKRILEAHGRSLVLRAPSRATRILLDVHGLVDLVEAEA
jgi:anti-anti-sigma factor